MKFLFIPEKENIEKAIELSDKYDMRWEFNDFMFPAVYEDESRVDECIAFYKGLGRDLSEDTMHGAFLGVDIAATDPEFRERSRKLCRQSMDIASRLNIKGVVFHTGLIGTLRLPDYVNRFLDEAEKFYGELCTEYPQLNIYMENSFEQEPDVFVKLMDRMQGHDNFKLCLDYGHAILTATPIETWVKAFAPHLGHMHLNDNDLKNDLHMAAGDGKIDFHEWNRLMQKYGCDTSVLLEMNGYDKVEKSVQYLLNINLSQHIINDTSCNVFDNQNQSVNSSKDLSEPNLEEYNADTDSSAPGFLDRRKGDRRKSDRLQKILDIGIALSMENDPDKLLSYILDNAMELTNCDGGSLYILKDNGLNFRIMKTKSKGVDRVLADGDLSIPPIPFKEENVCAYAAIHKKSLNIADVYESGLFDFSGPKSYDKNNNYLTKSMVAIPMIDHLNEVIGVMQLINAMNENGELVPFSDDDEKIISSLASQTAICLSNMTYRQELDRQIWSFTEALTEAIDMRTPYNGNHTKQVAKYAGMLADHFNKMHAQGTEEINFSDEHKAQLVMAAYLHDIGKMTTPTKVMNKSTRLEQYIDGINARLENIRLRVEIDLLNKNITQDEYLDMQNKLNEATEIARDMDSDRFLTDELEAKVDRCAGYIYSSAGMDGNPVTIPFFADEEINCMKIKKGTLTDDERQIMQDHVANTKKILDKVYFNRSYINAPVWAAQHHECLDGTGYPNHLSGDEISIESRILAVADICDALLSTDRPYKKPMPKEKAFAIMKDMAAEGKLDLRCIEYLEACIN